ncbi:M28 family peptidase [Dokdonia sinensis]|uniref:Vacuolar membrane protease n=1 Tax=Dokdonia sinensis TaxID=2479847 RepID=A0A3M0GL25_9FLAO|nr:M28 family peptidase [Dokdonia sinensis]RMB63362.1 M28 family peptidase [Dokdonia sinensis]
MKRLRHIVSFVLLLLLTWLSFYSLLPKKVTKADAPLTEFSTERALEQLKVISEKPHYVGSEAHAEVRDYIMMELRKLGLEPEIQEGFVLDSWWGSSTLVKPQNIVARYKGTAPTKSLLLMSHYDSAPHSKSYGASDAGSGVVTVLESLRAYLAGSEKPKNDIIVLFTDSEELGLDGATLFTKEHRWAKDVGVALNFEARGSGGPSNMIVETNGGNANLIKEFKNASPDYPVASSLMYSIYKMLPNDTDSTVLREEGDIDGFFFAFIDDHFNYHTANDTWQNLNPETLEHQGSYLMPLLKHFAQIDLSQIKTDAESVYFDTAVFKFVTYPFTWIWPMVIIAVLGFIGLLILGFRNKKLHGASIGKGFLIILVLLLVVVGTGFLYAGLSPVLYPQYEDMLPVFLYNGHWYTAAFVVLMLSLCFGLYSKFSKAEKTPSLMVAPLFFWIVINITVAIKLQGAAYFVIPLLFGLVAFYVMLKQSRPSMLLMVLLCAPAIFIFTPLIQFLPVGLGPEAYWMSMLFAVLLFGLLIPVLGYYRNKKFLGYAGLVLALLFFAIAHFKSDYSPERQKPNSLVYYHQEGKESAYWATYDNHLDPWVESYLGKNPDPANDYISNASGSKYNMNFRYAKATPVIDLAQSQIAINKDTVISGDRAVSLTLKPQRNVNRIRLFANKDVVFSELSFNGKRNTPDSTETIYKKRRTNSLLSYYVTPGDSLTLSYTVLDGADPELLIREYSFDLLENPKFTVAARPEYTMPKPFVVNDAIIVDRKINVDEYAFAKAEKDSVELNLISN